MTDTPTPALSSKEQLFHDRLPWVEKYRPKDLSGLIAHEDITDTVSKLIAKNSLPHLLFYGPPGTGKTSTIQAIARKLYGESYSRMVLELNASDDRGIDVVREQIKTFASSMFMFSNYPYKLIILDEADSMTNPAQTALRRVIEKYTRTTRFCMICNYVSKILPALQSRCTRFRFSPLPRSAITKRMKEIIECESLKVNDDALNSIITLSEGDMRKCLNILQSASMSIDVGTTIDKDTIYRCTGQPLPTDIKKILMWSLNQSYIEALNNILELKKEKGLSLTDIIKEIHFMTLKVPNIGGPALWNLVKELSDIEYNLSFGASEKLQLGSMLGSFQVIRDEAVKNNKDD
ncbi:replication factor C subunit [Heterostelium album PN500]|uniref:Replication factor C subunit n=1 Tax=Heterostelium pallidum (strain ATCC 26659 / Pp 5 / PN500) TaxID=670386 RepID=D3B3A5_HETP5|nr:replication factor C subunit [Heterostelium album PN500]EFA83803.1 replication factor C subunit [Heterostelium album PN500]|eukprot:XP_020435920.1 replication factor C subunit [Heterostelium album PN500]